MFIVRWWDDTMFVEVSTNSAGISRLTNLLERQKVYFKVSDSHGAVSQGHFGFGGYMYWLDPNGIFPIGHS